MSLRDLLKNIIKNNQKRRKNIKQALGVLNDHLEESIENHVQQYINNQFKQQQIQSSLYPWKNKTHNILNSGGGGSGIRVSIGSAGGGGGGGGMNMGHYYKPWNNGFISISNKFLTKENQSTPCEFSSFNQALAYCTLNTIDFIGIDKKKKFNGQEIWVVKILSN